MKKQGYTLITGASSGIGKELASVFASNGHSLILVARQADKLTALKSEIMSTHSVEVHIYVCDLSKQEAPTNIFRFCQENGYHVDCLVNNAGFGLYGMFAESNQQSNEQMIAVNITSLTLLTQLFLPDMLATSYGRILQVASTAAFQPGPTMAVYYATKAYVLHFSEALSNELEGTGVSVTALCPGPTSSGFQDVAKLQNSKLIKGRKLPSAADVAAYGYDALMRKKTVAIHGLLNYVMANSVRFTPRLWVIKLVRWLQDA